MLGAQSQEEGAQVFTVWGSGGFLPYPESPDSSWGRQQTLSREGILQLPLLTELSPSQPGAG